MRRKKRRAQGFNPFSFYGDLFKASMHMAELVNSSGQVIAHRTSLMSQAFKGELSPYDPEFTNMWQEKFAAGGESLAAALEHMGSGANILSPNLLQTQLRAAMQVMTPFRRRASANAKRLGKEKRLGS